MNTKEEDLTLSPNDSNTLVSGVAYRLFLDDIRMPEDVAEYILPFELRRMYENGRWIIARNYHQFVEYVQREGVPGLISFDHDLADEHYRESMYNPDKHYNNYYTDGTFKEKTGYCCAKWLIDFIQEDNLPVPKVICHSMNPIGKENIEGLFASTNKIVANTMIGETPLKRST